VDALAQGLPEDVGDGVRVVGGEEDAISDVLRKALRTSEMASGSLAAKRMPSTPEVTYWSMSAICSSIFAAVVPSLMTVTFPRSFAASWVPCAVALKKGMPFSLGMSTTLIGLPARSGGLVGWPPL